MPTSFLKLARRKGSLGDKQLAAGEYFEKRLRLERLNGDGRVGFAMTAAANSIKAALPRATTESKRERLETTSGTIVGASHMTVKAACAAGTAAEIGANVASGLRAVTALGAAVTLDAKDGRAFARDAFAGVARNDERRDREAQYYADTDGDVPATYGAEPNLKQLTYGELRAEGRAKNANRRAGHIVYDYSTREQDTALHASMTTGYRARKNRNRRQLDASRRARPAGAPRVVGAPPRADKHKGLHKDVSYYHPERSAPGTGSVVLYRARIKKGIHKGKFAKNHDPNSPYHDKQVFETEAAAIAALPAAQRGA